jgi:hypothetical protein
MDGNMNFYLHSERLLPESSFLLLSFFADSLVFALPETSEVFAAGAFWLLDREG